MYRVLRGFPLGCCISSRKKKIAGLYLLTPVALLPVDLAGEGDPLVY
jgi:hypothetical protein